MAEGVPYRLRPGEKVYGSSFDEDKVQLETALNEGGVMWGDAVAWVTKRLGIHQCAPCKARQEILNHMGEHGIAETVRLIRDTLKNGSR